MYLELTVSSFVCKNYTTKNIAEFFMKRKILCTVLAMCSTVDYNDEYYTIEEGFKIYIYNIIAKDFFETIWNPLSELLSLNCAHVKCESYIGCVNNWPEIMTESKCKKV